MSDESNTDVFRGKNFVASALREAGFSYLTAAGSDASGEEKQSALYELEDGVWYENAKFKFDVVDACICLSPLEQLVVLGPTGQCLFYGSGDSHVERIPVDRKCGPLRACAYVGDALFVVGMQRQVFRRVAVGRWEPLFSGISPKNDSVRGFEAVCGVSSDEVYAVGWEGEIFVFDGSSWRQLEAPTNLILHAICATPSGDYCIVGQHGTVLRGSGDKWEILGEDQVSEDLWSVCVFQGKVYASSFDGVYEILDDELRRVEMFDDFVPSTYSLASSGSSLWSTGKNNVCAFDGNLWREVASNRGAR